jgi:hypothetical protein
MGSDGSGSGQRRARGIRRTPLSPGPLKDLKDSIFELYVLAGRPTLDEISADVATLADELDLPALPRRDTINRVIGDARLPPRQHDAVAIAVVLARAAGRDRANVADGIRKLWTRAASESPPTEPLPSRLGWPIGRCDPLVLEVHPAMRLDGQQTLPELPAYVIRPHDNELAKIVNDAAGGSSRIAMLVGASSTGKTRACWQAIQKLPDEWHVWHPFDPTRPDAAAQALARVGPHTVIWFNEAQHYLLPANIELGERIAAGLRTLLSDPARSPVLVLGTMWPQYWDTLTGPPPPDDPDQHVQARQLLNGSDIAVPDAWSLADMPALSRAGETDRRLRDAAEHADAGRVTQYLAGVPELIQRYRNAPPTARAVITAAIDARRLGHPLPLSQDLLAHAAPHYLADVEWDQIGEDWLQRALAYTAKPCHGTAGPLTRIRPRPTGNQIALRLSYRLADYLQQRGAAERASILPPAGFWDAIAATVNDPAVLRAVADSAARRGRFCRAAPLYRLAGEGGDATALWSLVDLLERAGDLSGAQALRQRAVDLGTVQTASPEAGALRQVDDFWVVMAADLADSHANEQTPTSEDFGGEAAEAAARWAADHGDPTALGSLAELRERAGDAEGAIQLYRQAAHRGDRQSWDTLVLLLEQTGDSSGALEVALQAADQGQRSVLWTLAVIRERSGEPANAEAVALLAANRGDVALLGSLAAMRERTNDLSGAEALYRQASDRGDPYSLWSLAGLRDRVGDRDAAERLYKQAINRGTPSALASLASLRERMGDAAGAQRLYRRAADRGSVPALLSLAALYERMGNFPDAKQLSTEKLLRSGL